MREIVITQPQGRCAAGVRSENVSGNGQGGGPPSRDPLRTTRSAAVARPGAGGAVPHLSFCSPNPASAVSLLVLLCLSATVGAAASSWPSSTPVTHPGKPLARASESGPRRARRLRASNRRRRSVTCPSRRVSLCSATLTTENHSGVAFAKTVVTKRCPLCHEAARQDREKPAPRWRSAWGPCAGLTPAWTTGTLILLLPACFRVPKLPADVCPLSTCPLTLDPGSPAAAE